MVGITIHSRIGEKGQVVIPKPIRDQFDLTPHTQVQFTIEENKVVITPQHSSELLEEFLNAFPKKHLPKKIDWDEDYYDQYK